MAVTKLLLRVIDNSIPTNRTNVFKELLTQLKIALLGLKTVTTGFNALLEKKEDADILLSERGITLLQSLNLSVKVPPEIRARRSLFIRQVDQSIGQKSPDEIKIELIKNHNWLKKCEVTKIKNYTHIFKLECGSVAEAERVLTEGLLCFYIRISPNQIKREEYINLLMCFKCYKYEDHTTANCPHDDNIEWCSECGSNNHTFKECSPNNNKKCLNCKGNHRTMAMACPIKKELIKNKMKVTDEEKQSEKQNQTYAQAAKTVAQKIIEESNKKQTPTLRIHTNTELRTTIAVIHAHIHNLIAPGTYCTAQN